MDIRQIVSMNPNYFEINREERNYTAIFFAALCKKNNIERFLRFFGFDGEISPDFGIYFEYAYLRDLWNKIPVDNNEIRKEIIRKKLQISGIDDILNHSIIEINKIFGVGGKVSSEFIQYPGKWAVVKYDGNFPDNNDFQKICRFKWSFNIKPDIVIHLNKNRAICIEAKYESVEGTYPATDHEREIFKNRHLDPVHQIELQEYMMEDLLGVKTDFILLQSKKEKGKTYKIISWAEAFASIDMSELPMFAIEMTRKISKNI